MPNVASTRIGVPKPPNISDRFAQMDVRKALIKSPKEYVYWLTDKS